MGIIGSIIVGIIAGWLAEKIMGRNDSLLTNLIVGLLGGLVGGLLLNLFFHGTGAQGWIMSIITGTIGAVILLAIWGFIKSKTNAR